MARSKTTMVRVNKADGILISVTNYVWTPGSHAIRNALTQREYLHFMFYIAQLLEKQFKDAIDNQRYSKGVSRGSTKWSPLNKIYLKYKENQGLSTNIWEATGTLKEGIHLFKRNNYIVIGFKQNDYYPSTTDSLRINKVARYMEYGTAKMPARPLFRPVVAHMRRNIDRHYKKFLETVLKLSPAEVKKKLKLGRR